MNDDDKLPSDAEDSAEDVKKQKVIEPSTPAPEKEKEEQDPSEQPS